MKARTVAEIQDNAKDKAGCLDVYSFSTGFISAELRYAELALEAISKAKTIEEVKVVLFSFGYN